MALRRALCSLATIAVLGAGLFTGAQSASAIESRVLPATEQLTTMPCGDESPLQLFSLDEQSGVVAPAGDSAVGEVDGPALTCARQGAIDPLTGVLYFPLIEVSADYPDGRTTLQTFDPATGESSRVAEFPDDVFPTGLVIDNAGRAFSLVIRSGEGTFDLTLDRVDLATGELSPIGVPDLGSSSSGTLTVDPRTGVLYVVTGAGLVGTIDPLTGTVTNVGSIAIDSGLSVRAAVLDADGVLWFLRGVSEGAPDRIDLGSVRLADLEAGADVPVAADYPAALTRDGEWFETRSLFLTSRVAPAPAVVVPSSPQLAETGTDEEGLLFGGLTAGSLLLLGAGVLVATRAIRRSRI